MAEPVSAVTSKLDPATSHFITIVGRKGSGKSFLAHRLWDTYPYDRLVIDPTGDVDVDRATQTIEDIPLRFPSGADGERVSLRYVPDMGDPAHVDDMDRAVGIAFHHPRTLLWIDEIAELTSANKTPPHMRRALHQGRHKRLSMLMCGPRPIDINPLVMSQADYVYVFQLPNPADRKRVADCVGFDPKDLDELVAQLPRYGYLRWDARDQELTEFPPLPATSRAAVSSPR